MPCTQRDASRHLARPQAGAARTLRRAHTEAPVCSTSGRTAATRSRALRTSAELRGEEAGGAGLRRQGARHEHQAGALCSSFQRSTPNPRLPLLPPPIAVVVVVVVLQHPGRTTPTTHRSELCAEDRLTGARGAGTAPRDWPGSCGAHVLLGLAFGSGAAQAWRRRVRVRELVGPWRSRLRGQRRGRRERSQSVRRQACAVVRILPGAADRSRGPGTGWLGAGSGGGSCSGTSDTSSCSAVIACWSAMRIGARAKQKPRGDAHTGGGRSSNQR